MEIYEMEQKDKSKNKKDKTVEQIRKEDEKIELTKQETRNILHAMYDLIWAYEHVSDIKDMKVFLSKNIEVLSSIFIKHENDIYPIESNIVDYPEKYVDGLLKKYDIEKDINENRPEEYQGKSIYKD
jgi:hypothetical protein